MRQQRLSIQVCWQRPAGYLSLDWASDDLRISKCTESSERIPATAGRASLCHKIDLLGLTIDQGFDY